MKLQLLFYLLALPVFGGYRVYQLKVTHHDARGKVLSTEIVLSNLDHFQYENYHAGYRWDRVELLDTWYCPGDTSRHKYCDRPVVKQRGIADIQNKRGFLPLARQPIIP